MQRGHAVKTVSVILLLFLIVILYRASDYTRLDNRTNIDEVRDLYEKVNQTLVSSVSARENTQIIRDRLECYAVHNDYAARIRVCNNTYVKAIVKQARQEVKSRPDIGRFVKRVNLCPIMYNLCVGKTKNDQERCIEFERQCIDHMLDAYWRGAEQYTQQQYRAE